VKDIFGNELNDEDSLLYFIEGMRINFGFNVQRALNRHKRDRKWLAEKLDLTEEQLSKMVFEDEANPNLEMIAKICHHLNIKNVLE